MIVLARSFVFVCLPYIRFAVSLFFNYTARIRAEVFSSDKVDMGLRGGQLLMKSESYFSL